MQPGRWSIIGTENRWNGYQQTDDDLQETMVSLVERAGEKIKEGSRTYTHKNDAYGHERNYNVGRVSNSTGFRSRLVRSHSDCQVSSNILYVPPWRCLRASPISEWSTGEVCPTCHTRPHTISFAQSELSQISKRTTFVRHCDISFLLAAYGTQRRHKSKRMLLMCRGWIPN